MSSVAFSLSIRSWRNGVSIGICLPLLACQTQVRGVADDSAVGGTSATEDGESNGGGGENGSGGAAVGDGGGVGEMGTGGDEAVGGRAEAP